MDAAELAFAGVARQAELIRAGEVKPRELVEVYLERIGRIDPRLNAFRTVYAERALAEADQAQARLREADPRPLLGVPIALKDNTDVAGDVTTHGTRAYGEPARTDSEVVRRVRAAGAIVLGKTLTPELCIWPFTESATWGMTRNPWDETRTPAGSSGGSGAAVAAGLAAAALGSDGGGSIRYPSAVCGLFGLKPQRGRISLAPLSEHWFGLSVYGWLARRVIDSALLMDATAGGAPNDAEVPPPPERPYAEAARSDPGKLRIALSLKPPPGMLGGLSPEVRRTMEDTAELLRSLGHEVRERVPDYGITALTWIARFVHGAREDAVMLAHPERLERRTRSVVRMGTLLPAAALRRAREAEAGITARLNAVFADHDVLLTPMLTGPVPAVGHWEGRGALWTLNGIAPRFPFAPPWNVTGQPAAAVPAGIGSDGLPIGVQFVAPPNGEATLFSLAAQLEVARPWADRTPPIS